MSRNTIRIVPTKNKSTEIPDFAGDYFLKQVVLINHLGFKVDVKFLMTNNVTDRYYGWPMNQVQFAEFLTDKYGAGNEDAIHHYEVTKDSGRTTGKGPSDYSHKVEVNSDTDNASSISNREYEERDQDKKRQIQLLNKSLLGDFVAEFDRLIAE